MTSSTHDTHIDQLRHAVEQKAGCKMSTPRDFDLLSDRLFDECHEMLSPSTLKRIWGYVQSGGRPRLSSLSLLARYVGYADWEAFKAKADLATIQPDIPPTPLWKRPWAIAAATLLLAAVIAVVILENRDKEAGVRPQVNVPSGQRVLHMGQDCFASIDEYLVLFGITNHPDTAYFCPVPGLTQVFLWGPEYGNTTWHNEGDLQQLMPTITEWWTPRKNKKQYYTDEYIKLVNEKLYFERMVREELRITFMRDIADSLYLFLGVYAIDREASSQEKTVWKRVADSLDIGRINHLRQELGR